MKVANSSLAASEIASEMRRACWRRKLYNTTRRVQLQSQHDKYDVDNEGGRQVAAAEFDSKYDAVSMHASLVLLAQLL
jgi:hypothetical protein